MISGETEPILGTCAIAGTAATHVESTRAARKFLIIVRIVVGF
jgi:hypothetical protein